MAKVLIVNSSPRKESNSRILAAKVAAGAVGKGHSVKTVEIGKAAIHPCIGCEACQKNPGVCVFKDEMTDLYKEVADAEIVIFSSPIYYFTINAQMKLFLDRTFALPGAFKGKKLGGVFAYGDVDPVKSGCINAIRMFQDICNFELIKADWVGAVYGSWMEEGAASGSSELLKEAEEFGAAL